MIEAKTILSKFLKYQIMWHVRETISVVHDRLHLGLSPYLMVGYV